MENSRVKWNFEIDMYVCRECGNEVFEDDNGELVCECWGEEE